MPRRTRRTGPRPALPILFLALLTAGLLVAGCGERVDDARTLPSPGRPSTRNWEPAVSRDLPAIQTEGILRLIASPDPATYMLVDGRETGFEYELVKKFAHLWNLRLEVVVPEPGVHPYALLNEGRGDIVTESLPMVDALRRAGLATGAVARIRLCLVLPAWDARSDSTLLHEPLTVRVPIPFPAAGILQSRAEARGQRLLLIAAAGQLTEEDLILDVADGRIPLTIASARDVRAAQASGANVRLGPALDETRDQVWLVRRNAAELAKALNRFLRRNYRAGLDAARRSRAYGVLEDRFFLDPAQVRQVRRDDHRLDRCGRLSPWDDLVRAACADYDIDWLLADALIFEESRFDPGAASGAGAVGLMQLLSRFAADDSNSLHDPAVNIRSGVEHLAHIRDGYSYLDSLDRWKFTLATYHAGQGHMNDARRLTMDAGLDPNRWEGNVAVGLRRVRSHDLDEQIRHGFYRGDISVRYAESILDRTRVYHAFWNLWLARRKAARAAPAVSDSVAAAAAADSTVVD